MMTRCNVEPGSTVLQSDPAIFLQDMLKGLGFQCCGKVCENKNIFF